MPPTRRQILCASLASAAVGIAKPLAAALPDDAAAPLNGEALLIVFPDYPVSSEYGYTALVGHAGALLISPNGLTKYHEFGRYPPGTDGRTRTIPVSNAVIAEKGKATAASLKTILGELSQKTGKNGRIRAAYFLNMNFDAMQAKAAAAQPVYDVTSNNCGHFAERVILAGNASVDKPVFANPTPNNLVDEYIEEKNAEVLFDPATGSFSIGEGDESDAKT